MKTVLMHMRVRANLSKGRGTRNPGLSHSLTVRIHMENSHEIVCSHRSAHRRRASWPATAPAAAQVPKVWEVVADNDNTFKVVGQKKAVITVKAGQVVKIRVLGQKGSGVRQKRIRPQLHDQRPQGSGLGCCREGRSERVHARGAGRRRVRDHLRRQVRPGTRRHEDEAGRDASNQFEQRSKGAVVNLSRRGLLHLAVGRHRPGGRRCGVVHEARTSLSRRAAVALAGTRQPAMGDGHRPRQVRRLRRVHARVQQDALRAADAGVDQGVRSRGQPSGRSVLPPAPVHALRQPAVRPRHAPSGQPSSAPTASSFRTTIAVSAAAMCIAQCPY